MPLLSHHVALAELNGKIYVMGGFVKPASGPSAWIPIDNALVYEYDPATDKWAKKKNMPLLSHHVALAELNGKIYVMGGFVKPASGPSAWIPIDNAWEYD